MKFLSLIFLMVIISFLVGCMISGSFVNYKGNDRYFFRTYYLYKLDEVKFGAVIIAALFNTFLGSIVVVPLTWKLFFPSFW